MRSALYPHLVAQAERWMIFAINKCEKGRGRRPKYVVNLSFLGVFCQFLYIVALALKLALLCMVSK